MNGIRAVCRDRAARASPEVGGDVSNNDDTFATGTACPNIRAAAAASSRGSSRRVR